MLKSGGDSSSPLWQKRIAPLSEAELNAKIAARIAVLEDGLRSYGLQLVCGAEQEFLTLDRQGCGSRRRLNTDHLDGSLRQAGFASLERVYKEKTANHKYEVVLGTLTNNLFAPHPACDIASETDSLHSALPKLLKGHHISFAPIHPKMKDATAGLHTNFSLYDDAGNNLFYDAQRELHSALAERCALNLVELQKQGLPVYGSDPAFYARIDSHVNAPGHFGFRTYKGQSSAALRTTTEHNDKDGFRSTQTQRITSFDVPPDKKETYRLEDRLAAANSNPYLVMLAGVGALYHTVEQEAARQGGSFHAEKVKWSCAPREFPPIPKDPKAAMDTFCHSKLWRETAGPELHAQIAGYLMAQQARSAFAGTALIL